MKFRYKEVTYIGKSTGKAISFRITGVRPVKGSDLRNCPLPSALLGCKILELKQLAESDYEL
jgi:hypothetical protein